MVDKIIVDPNRLVTRNRGCYNCTAYECGESFKQYYSIIRTNLIRDLRVKVAATAAIEVIPSAHLKRMTASIDQRARTGAFGLCLVGGAKSDFTTFNNLCEKWNGVQGTSLGTSGRPLDKLGDELTDIADSKAPNVETMVAVDPDAVGSPAVVGQSDDNGGES